MIAGIPYKDVHALEFSPGEIRLDITPESTWALFEQKKDNPSYLAALEDGKEKLKALREDNTFVNLKDLRAENQSVELDNAFNEKKLEAERERLKKMTEQRANQAEAETKAREEKERQREERLQAEKQLKEEKERHRKELLLADRESRIEKERRRRQAQQIEKSTQISKNINSSPSYTLTSAGIGIVGLGLVAGIGSTMSSEDSSDKIEKTTHPKPTLKNATDIADTANMNSTEEHLELNDTIYTIGEISGDDIMVINVSGNTTTNTSQLSNEEDVNVNFSKGNPRLDGTTEKKVEADTSLFDDDIEGEIPKNKDHEHKEMVPLDATSGDSSINDDDQMIEDHLSQLAIQEQALKDALVEANESLDFTATSNDSEFDDFLDGIDSFDSDWLRLVQDIRNDEDEERSDESISLLPAEDTSITKTLMEKNFTTWRV
jgi:hypothetical protein